MIVGAANVEEFGQCGNVFGKLVAIELGDEPFPKSPDANLAVVVEHGDTVAGQPHVALETGRAEAERKFERLDGVLLGVRTGPTVGEHDRRIELGRKTLLHARPSCQPHRLRRVFNLQGSELIIILLLALVVLGPEKLPEAMRRAGKFYAELKKMSSGFQEEFRSAVDEPMREMRETANLLKDSADFRKLQDGERDEKTKSAEMADASDIGTSPAAPDGRAAADGGDLDDHPDADGDRPFDVAPTSPRRQPFAGSSQSSAAPRPRDAERPAPAAVFAAPHVGGLPPPSEQAEPIDTSPPADPVAARKPRPPGQVPPPPRPFSGSSDLIVAPSGDARAPDGAADASGTQATEPMAPPAADLDLIEAPEPDS